MATPYLLLFYLVFLGSFNFSGGSVSAADDCGNLELRGFFMGVSVRCVHFPEVPYGEHYIEVTARNMVDYLLVTPEDDPLKIRISSSSPDPAAGIMLQDPTSALNKLVGIALDGIPIYSALSAPDHDVVSAAVSVGTLDRCGGMWGDTGDGERYHYRVMPSCILITRPANEWANDTLSEEKYRDLTRHQSMEDVVMKRRRFVGSLQELQATFEAFPGRHVLGWALDGHAILSPIDADGRTQRDLDNCNGKYTFFSSADDTGSDWSVNAPAPLAPGSTETTHIGASQRSVYSYFSSREFPYLVGCDGPGVYERGVHVPSGLDMEEVAREFAGVAYTSCPGGSYPDPASPEGCVLCEAGKYSTSATAQGPSVCNMDCPRGSYCPAGSVKPLHCPAGRYGAATRAQNEACSGECEAGYFCPASSTSPRAFPCGNTTYLCPGGAARPRRVDDGFYTLPEEGSRISTRTAQAPCKAGSYCVPTSGVQVPCPAGRFGDREAHTGAGCTGPCPLGHYCPKGSVLPRACPAGRYGSQLQLKDSACSGVCARGHYCPTASTNSTQVKCPGGRFGAVEGLTSEHCSTLCEMASVDAVGVQMSAAATPECESASICAAGYFCPPGSVSEKEHRCGGPAVYCPPGSSSPTPVEPGYYSVGPLSLPSMPLPLLQDPGDADTRTSQVQCEPGFYCFQGVKYACQPGRYNDQIGKEVFPDYLACPQCDAGHYCDEASPSRTQHVCGGPHVYCPTGTHTPNDVPPGFYSVGAELTTRYDIVACESGFSCVRGIKRPCAPGTYSASGSPHVECDGPCTPGYYCGEGSSDPQETICPGGRYGHAGASTEQCTGSCLKGYYCPAGSTTPWQMECGHEAVYCPHGSSAPVPVVSGYYSTGGNSTTRYAQEPCGMFDTPPAGRTRPHELCPSTTVP